MAPALTWGCATRPTGERGQRPPEEFIARPRAQGASYHDLHPFHRRLEAGDLTGEELQRWVTNRLYYQKFIPLKNAAILANCPEVADDSSAPRHRRAVSV